MSDTTPKARLLNVLANDGIDRPPVICPGGMMNAAVSEITGEKEACFPAAHKDGVLMAALARLVQEKTGFENFGIPFCMTVEAEVLGSTIDYGSVECEPKIVRERFPDSRRVVYEDIGDLLARGRIGEVRRAVVILAEKYPEIPVIGSITGPVSLASSIVDPMSLLADLARDPASVHRLMAYLTEFLTAFAEALVKSGVSVITIADPTATGEILGPHTFGAFAAVYLKRLVDAVHGMGLPVITHICGRIIPVKSYLPFIGADAMSLDAKINLRKLKEEASSMKVMGNFSTFLLGAGTCERIGSHARRLVENGIDIIAPACGLGTDTPLSHIHAFTRSVTGN